MAKHASLLKRIAAGVVLGPLVIASAWTGTLWSALVSIAAILAVLEAFRVVRAGGLKPVTWAAIPLIVILPEAIAPASYIRNLINLGENHGATIAMFAIALSVTIGFVAQMRRPPTMRSTADWAVTLALPLYIGGMAAFAKGLRDLPNGAEWTVAWLLLVWINDTFAFLGGRRFGRTPMAPFLSPRKTREGLAIATVATLLAATTPTLLAWTGRGLDVPFDFVALFGLALVVSLIGPLGDLSISLLKRDAGVKDSGHLIPGHGGMLDRTDSLVYTAPWAYLVAILFSGAAG